MGAAELIEAWNVGNERQMDDDGGRIAQAAGDGSGKVENGGAGNATVGEQEAAAGYGGGALWGFQRQGRGGQGDAAEGGGPGFFRAQGDQGGDGRNDGIAQGGGQGESGPVGSEARSGLSAGGKHDAAGGKIVDKPRAIRRSRRTDREGAAVEKEADAGALAGEEEGVADGSGVLVAGIDAAIGVDDGRNADAGKLIAQKIGGQGSKGGDGKAAVASESSCEIIFGGGMAQIASAAAGGREFSPGFGHLVEDGDRTGMRAGGAKGSHEACGTGADDEQGMFHGGDERASPSGKRGASGRWRLRGSRPFANRRGRGWRIP